MSATRPAKYTDAHRPPGAPDLAHFRQRYPLTVANFGALHQREEWLRRIWRTEASWREAMETRGGKSACAEAITRGAPPAGATAEGEFDVVYAGGTFGLLHAATLAARHGRRVFVFDAGEVGRAGRNWNVSGEDLAELERAGLFTKEEIEGAVVRRYRAGLVKFHDASSRVKAERLFVGGVFDVSLDADKLLELASRKLRSLAGEGCALAGGLRFVRAHVEPHRVTVEAEDARGERHFYAARLFVDATGATSPAARQLNDGRAMTHVCPTVGTVARGFARGEGPDAVDAETCEILVSTEDARDHRQLVWGGHAAGARADEFATHLFFYDALDSPADKSLLGLFENYFERLPAYKRAGAQWRVERPVFGYAPAFRRYGWRGHKKTTDDRVMLLGDGAGQGSPLAFGGPGGQLRALRRAAHLLHLALDADLLDARSLAEINAEGPRAASAASLAEFMRPTPKGAPSSVNETLNAVMAALHHLDERVRRELFLDRVSLTTLRNILGHTAKLYPRIFSRVREHLGARGTFWSLANVAHAVWSERRGRATAAQETDDPSEEAARKFARHVALYKNGRGAEG